MNLSDSIAELQKSETLSPINKIWLNGIFGNVKHAKSKKLSVIEYYSFCSSASCAQIPIGLGSRDLPFLGFTTQHFFTLSVNDSHSWCSSRSDNYIELDLMFVHQICALKVNFSQVHRWALWYSNDTKNWSKYFQVDTCQEMLNYSVVWSVEVVRLTDVWPVPQNFFQLLFSYLMAATERVKFFLCMWWRDI